MHFNLNLKAYHINLKGLKIEKEQSYAHKANSISGCLVFNKISFQYNVLNFRAQINFASISSIDKNTLTYTFWFVSWYYVGPINLRTKKKQPKKNVHKLGCRFPRVWQQLSYQFVKITQYVLVRELSVSITGP